MPSIEIVHCSLRQQLSLLKWCLYPVFRVSTQPTWREEAITSAYSHQLISFCWIRISAYWFIDFFQEWKKIEKLKKNCDALNKMYFSLFSNSIAFSRHILDLTKEWGNKTYSTYISSLKISILFIQTSFLNNHFQI